MRLSYDKLVTPTLLRRFAAEAQFEGGDGRYYACLLREDGGLVTHHPGAPRAAADQVLWAADVLRALNRELHHDGAWVVLFTQPAEAQLPECVLQIAPEHREYRRYVLIWVDADADPQFSQEWTAGESELFDFAEVMMAGIESTMAKCEASWTLWYQMMHGALAPAEGQTFKRAQGERAPSIGH